MHRLSFVIPKRCLAFAVAAAFLSTVVPAAAQVGTAVPNPRVQAYPGAATLGFTGFAEVNIAESLGGVTLFSAYVPGGPVIARLPMFAPFTVNPDDLVPLNWTFGGLPPGTYYIALIYGIVNTPSIPAASWAKLVIPGACTAAPGLALPQRQSTGPVTDAIRVLLSSFGGCATSYLVEVGTTPGGTQIAAFEQTALVLAANGVPSGNYYARVRAKNQFGVGPASAVLSLAVPECSSQRPDEIDDLKATVNGNVVTLSWTPPATPPGRPITYYEIEVLSGVPAGQPRPRYLLPSTAASVSASLPSGTYSLVIHAGNACASEVGGGPDVITFTVP